MITPFKNRKIDIDKPVELYRNLTRRGYIFSVRQCGKVIGHTSNIVLTDCELVVNKSGKERCIKTNERNVHAFVRGHVGTNDDIQLSFSFDLLYNPMSSDGFYTMFSGNVAAFKSAKVVYINKSRILMQI